MMLLRFKASRAPFRRAGLLFTTTAYWFVRSAEELQPNQLVRLVADPTLAVELADFEGEIVNGEPVGDVSWQPFPADRRAIAAMMIAFPEQEWDARAATIVATTDPDQESQTASEGALPSADGDAPAGSTGASHVAPAGAIGAAEAQSTGASGADAGPPVTAAVPSPSAPSPSPKPEGERSPPPVVEPKPKPRKAGGQRVGKGKGGVGAAQ